VTDLPQKVSPGVPEIHIVPGDKRSNTHAFVSPFLVPSLLSGKRHTSSVSAHRRGPPPLGFDTS